MLTGKALLNDSRQNKGTAFTEEERKNFGLIGLLPPRVETIETQSERCYSQFLTQPSDIAKHLYLHHLLNQNETLFYFLVGQHLSEMLPVLYTPTVGESIENYHLNFHEPRGIFLAYPNREHIKEILQQVKSDVDLVLVTDGERILGIGDQGVGSINICIGKLAVYTLCAGVNPYRTLPIVFDVGTNNERLLNDPHYLGWQHKRITGKEYDDFIDECVSAIHETFPNALLHWEDFARDTARKNLERYQNKMCTFNDDMQGTAVITVTAIRSALQVIKQTLTEQKIVFFGAGIAATGIADLLVEYMVQEGLSEQEARSKIYLLNSKGLVTEETPNLLDFQKPYARNLEELSSWQCADENRIELLDVITHVHPTILIGCSTVFGAFDETIVKTMAQHVERPMIFPLSNPTSKSEATPHDLLTWTNDKALIATGSPFPNEMINGKERRISQCNNLFIFPGLGLGTIAVKAKRITQAMLHAAGDTLLTLCPTQTDPTAPLLPSIEESQSISTKIAEAVTQAAIAEHQAPQTDILKAIQTTRWIPSY